VQLEGENTALFFVKVRILRNMPMKFSKKLNVLFALVLVCLILLVASSYAWLSLATSPEINSIDTNIGANGSLEIALLTEQTYADPMLIQSKVGDSAAEQDTIASNQSWGNVIELDNSRYGLGEITLLPARLNMNSADGAHVVSDNMLKTAEFGIDGRMTELSEDTRSAIYGENGFTYYVDRQMYGVRAIGTISNLTSQQTALAYARTNIKANTAAASRTVKLAWRDHASGVMDIFFRRYSLEQTHFTAEDAAVVRNLANEVLDALNYVDAALRQGMIGMAASMIADEVTFESICAQIYDTSIPLSAIVTMLGSGVPAELVDWVEQVDEMKLQGQVVLAGTYAFIDGDDWEAMEPLLDALLDADQAYIGERRLSDKEAFADITEENTVLLPQNSGLLAQIAAYTGNYSAFAEWKEGLSVEAVTADLTPVAYLNQLASVLEGSQAASGGWTRAVMDDIYGYAVDMAFRCNQETDLLLQTVPANRVEGSVEAPATQGGGSYMRFNSESLDTEQLLMLMDTIRVGFLDDKNTLLGIAKLNISNYEEQEEGVFAPLYLYSYSSDDNGRISVHERQSEDTAILALERNAPAIVTVVVWMDGDSVDNSMVSTTAHYSMDGVLNLQFASSASLQPANIVIND